MRAYFETTNQSRFGTQIPETRFRWELAPTLFVKGVPLAFNAMYTTEDGTLGRSINGFSFSLNLGTNELEQIIRQRINTEVSSLASQAAGAVGDTRAGQLAGQAQDAAANAGDIQQNAEERIAQLQDLREDLENARPSLSQLQEMGLVTAQERLAMRFPALGFGTTYPTYSPYTLNGVAVNGFNVDFAPGHVLIGAAVGRVRDPEPFNNRFVPGIDSLSYDRTLYAGRVGVGRPDGRHFLISGTYFADEKSADSLLLGAPRRPEENVIAGISTRWSDAQRRFNIRGELAAGVYTRDRQGAELADEIPGPQFLKNAVTVNSTSSADYAGRGEVDIRLRQQGLKLNGSYEQIGAGFATLGNPLLRNDLRRFGAGFEKQLARRQVAVAASLRQEKNNLSGFQLYTTTSRVINTRMSVRLRGKPYATVQFIPTSQKIDASDALSGSQAGSFISEFNSSYLTLTAGHRYKLGGSASGITNVNVSNQKTTSDGFGLNFATTVFGVTQSVTVSRITVTGVASLFRQRDVANPVNSNVFDVGVTVEPLRGVVTTVGVNMFSESDRSNERGVYGMVSADAGPLGTVYARVETSRYTDEVFDANSFNQATLTASVLRRW